MNVSFAALVLRQFAEDWNCGAFDTGKFLLQVLNFFGQFITWGRLIDLKVRSEEILVRF